LSNALEDFSGSVRFNEGIWTDVLVDIVLPLIRNMRDVRRYCASARGTVRALRDDIESVDVLGLEAIRVFLPDVYAGLSNAREALTQTGYNAGSPEMKAQVEQVLNVAGKDRKVVSALIERLFPAGLRYIGGSIYGPDHLGSWLTSRRVAHAEILNLYLERVAGDGLWAFTDAERAFTMIDDENALDTYLRSISLDRLEDVIAALENYEGHYPIKGVPSATTVLLNLLPILPERPRGMLGADARIVVTRVVLRLMRQLPGPEAVERAVREILQKLSSLSSRFQLTLLVGYRENAGHKLISPSAAEALESELAEAVLAAQPNILALEWDLLRVLYWVQERMPEGTSSLPTQDNIDLNAKILINARAEVRSQDMGSRVVKRKLRLQWDVLLKLYGSEEALGAMINSLEASRPSDEGLLEMIALAQRYLGGTAPRDFWDEE